MTRSLCDPHARHVVTFRVASRHWPKASGPTDDARQHASSRRGLTRMANDDPIALLKKGIAAWNKWRKENPDICPDLSGADLRRAHLYGANLSGADLSGADLSEAGLSGAGLS